MDTSSKLIYEEQGWVIYKYPHAPHPNKIIIDYDLYHKKCRNYYIVRENRRHCCPVCNSTVPLYIEKLYKLLIFTEEIM